MDSIDYTEYVFVETTDENGTKHVIRIPLLHTKMSITITDLLKEIGGLTTQNNPIPVTQITSETMNTIVEYLAYHFEHPEEHENFSGITKGFENMGEWDKQFVIRFSRDLLTKVTLAANYLNINDLLMLCCKQHAANIKDMTHTEKNAYLGITEKYVRPLRKNCTIGGCGQSNRIESEFCVKCGNTFGNTDGQEDYMNNDNNAVEPKFEPMDESE